MLYEIKDIVVRYINLCKKNITITPVIHDIDQKKGEISLFVQIALASDPT